MIERELQALFRQPAGSAVGANSIRAAAAQVGASLRN